MRAMSARRYGDFIGGSIARRVVDEGEGTGEHTAAASCGEIR
jgi:hypothetical protein